MTWRDFDRGIFDRGIFAAGFSHATVGIYLLSSQVYSGKSFNFFTLGVCAVLLGNEENLVEKLSYRT